VWDNTDLTYVLRGSIILSGPFTFDVANGTGAASFPNPTQYTVEHRPGITLTIQSALPGTLLADGESIPRPGQSVVVKLMSDFTPVGAGNLGTFGSTGAQSDQNVGAGFVVGVDDGIDPPTPSPLVDPGAFGEIRIV